VYHIILQGDTSIFIFSYKTEVLLLIPFMQSASNQIKKLAAREEGAATNIAQVSPRQHLLPGVMQKFGNMLISKC